MNICGIIISGAFVICLPVSAQWLNYPTPGIPRLPDGKPNLAAPVPKTPDGKPDLSGIWEPRFGYTGDIAKDLKPAEVPFQPWAEALFKHRQETMGREDPQARCVLSGVPRENVVPYPFKILNTTGMIVILYEALHSYRQIFMDGRELFPLLNDPFKRCTQHLRAHRPVHHFANGPIVVYNSLVALDPFLGHK